MSIRGVRGATTTEANTSAAILTATRELLEQIIQTNDFRVEDVASAFFTATPDLNAAFPATAARQIGWAHVALMDSAEMEVPGALPMCIRVLLHVNTEKGQDQVAHVYLRGAQHLRASVPPIE